MENERCVAIEKQELMTKEGLIATLRKVADALEKGDAEKITIDQHLFSADVIPDGSDKGYRKFKMSGWFTLKVDIKYFDQSKVNTDSNG